MIRINLLAPDRRKGPKASFDVARLIPFACSLVLVVAIAAMGGWYWWLEGEAVRLDEEIAVSQREQERLQSVLVQVARFESRKVALEQRVALIEQLRHGQTGPVHMLDELSRSLPDRLWLTELKQEQAELTIQGRASSLTALSDFVGNLELSSYFRRPVEILNSQVEPLAQGDLIRFTVKAEFAPPGS